MASPPPQPRSPRAAAAAAAVAVPPPPTWGDVPDNVLVRVSAFLPCLADRVHMACVNRLWRAAVLGLRRPPPPVLPPLPPLPTQLPWLIFPSTDAPIFFSPISRRYHRICRLPPDVRAARCCGSAYGGWLVLALDSRHAHALYNLHTGARIPLPRDFALPPTGVEFPLVVRAATLSAPPSPEPYMVAAIVLVGHRSTAAFWTEGDESFFSTGRLHTVRPQDVIFHGGAFFYVTSNEGLITYWPFHDYNGNVSMARVDYRMEAREDFQTDLGFVRGHGTMRRYLVESRGELLMVVRYVYDDGGTEVLRVFRFILIEPITDAQPPRGTWEDLGDQLQGRMLFLGAGCSRAFEIGDYDGFQDQESMIYFLDDSLTPVPSADIRRWYTFADMGRYSMEDMASVAWPPGPRPPRFDNAPPTWWLH
ncbi:hypothetical protein ACP4OV_011468 [Aristida adscensionis]